MNKTRLFYLVTYCSIFFVSATAAAESTILKCSGQYTRVFLPALGLNSPGEREEKKVGPYYYQLEFSDNSRVRVLGHTTGKIIFGWKQCSLTSTTVTCKKHTTSDSTTQLRISRETGNLVWRSTTTNQVYISDTTQNLQCEVSKTKKLF